MPGNLIDQIDAEHAGPFRTVDALTESRRPLDGAGEKVRILGDVGPGSHVLNASVVVVDGQIDGTETNPCRVESAEAVVVMGSARHAQIRAREIYLGKGARSCSLGADGQVCVYGDLMTSSVRVGGGERRLEMVGTLRNAISREREEADALNQKILQEKRRLDNVLSATGIVFNLNIGQIVRQEHNGLQIDLESFYGALPNRSEEEIDRALKEFFARAVLGLLTRVNHKYISSGPGHRQRFASVVQRLQRLVVLTRECDKRGRLVQQCRDRLRVEVSKSETERPFVAVSGVVLPETHVCVSQLDVRADEGGDFEVSLKRNGMTLREGNGRSRDEVVIWQNEKAVDMIFVPPDSLRQVVFRPQEDRIGWRDIGEKA